MKKVTNINLGGFPFSVDDDAYHKLDRYFNTIENHFKHSEGFEEITTDIEYRVAEILNERLGRRQIVTITDVTEVMAVMGQPEDFGADASGASYSETYQDTGHHSTHEHVRTSGRRIFRDPEDKVLGGVCSGLSQYFGISDPLWLRIGFAVLVFAGVTPILYPFLWVVIPMAKTSSDKLSMKGEPANINNIAKAVEDEISGITDRINDLSDELKAKKKVRRNRRKARKASFAG